MHWTAYSNTDIHIHVHSKRLEIVLNAFYLIFSVANWKWSRQSDELRWINAVDWTLWIQESESEINFSITFFYDENLIQKYIIHDTLDDLRKFNRFLYSQLLYKCTHTHTYSVNGARNQGKSLFNWNAQTHNHKNCGSG